MPETIKQFINGTVTQTNLEADRATLPIFTNDSSTTRIVRDIQVQNSDISASEAELVIDNTVVMDSFEDAAGTVVVPPSNSLDIKLKTPVANATKTSLNLRHVFYQDANTAPFTPITGLEKIGTSDSRFPYDFSAVTLNTTTTTGTAIDIIPPYTPAALCNTSTFNRFSVFEVPNENLYYSFWVDDNSQMNFYKVDKTSNTVTQLISSSYSAPAFDYVNNKFYYKDGATIYEFDLTVAGGILANTGTYRIAHSNFYSTQSSYATGGICNNHYFFAYAGNIYVRNLSQPSGYGVISGVYSQGPNSRVYALYNQAENRFYVFAGSYSRDSTYVYYFDASQTESTVAGYTIAVTGITTNLKNYLELTVTGGSGYNPYGWTAEPLDTNLVSLSYSDDATRLYKGQGGALVYTGIEVSVPGGFNTGVVSFKTVQPAGSTNDTSTNLPLSNYTISTKVRAEGVEIT
jgi:hypothetical protein